MSIGRNTNAVFVEALTPTLDFPCHMHAVIKCCQYCTAQKQDLAQVHEMVDQALACRKKEKKSLRREACQSCREACQSCREA